MAFGDDTASTSVPVPWGGILVLGVLAVGLVALGPSASPRPTRLRRNANLYLVRKPSETARILDEDDDRSLSEQEAWDLGSKDASRVAKAFGAKYRDVEATEREIDRLARRTRKIGDASAANKSQRFGLSLASFFAYADGYADHLFEVAHDKMLDPAGDD